MIKAGIIGLGKMGMSHFAIINAHPNVNVVAICDNSNFVLRVVEKHGKVKCFTDYRKMIGRCELDCVIISTPTSTHSEIGKYVMEQNIHVFVEKPLCLHPKHSYEMVQVAEKNGLVNQVGYHNRFIGVFQETKKLVDEGAIGDIYYFSAEIYGPAVLKKKGNTWRTKRHEGGGCLYDYASHAIDLVNFTLGTPDRVIGTDLKKIYSSDVEDAVYSTLLYDNGITGQLCVNWSDETYRRMTTQISLIGTNGKIISNRQECRLYVGKYDGFAGFQRGWNVFYTTDVTRPVWFYLRGEEYSAQIDYFIQRIKDKKAENINSFRSALQTDRVIELLKNDSDERAFLHG